MNAGLLTLDRAAAASGLMALGLRRARRGLTILMYHRVLPAARAGTYPLANLVVTQECFESQVRWLATHTRVVTAQDGAAALARGSRDRRPLVALTFDDGYADNAQHAAPVLESHGVRGTFFVTTGFIRGEALWFDRAAWFWTRRRQGAAEPGAAAPAKREIEPHLRTLDAWLGWLKTLVASDRERVLGEIGATEPHPECEPMSIAQVTALARAGHEIGAHTVTHPILTREPPDRVTAELVGARREVESWTGQSPAGFCYPNGRWSDEIRAACLAAGYAYATTTARGINMAGGDAMTLHRRFITPESTTHKGRHRGSAFAAEVLGLHDLLRGGTGRRRGARCAAAAGGGAVAGKTALAVL